MKNSDLKRFFENDASNNNNGFARLNTTGSLNAPVSSSKVNTGNAAEGMLMAADGQGGVKFVEPSSGGTTVVANPALAGTEADLTGLQVGETKYKVPSGGGSDPYVTSFGRFIDYYPRVNGDNDILTYVKALNPYPNKTIGELKQEFNISGDSIYFGIAADNGNGEFPIMIVGLEITGDNELDFYIDVGDEEDFVTEFTDDVTINDIVGGEYAFIINSSVNPKVGVNNLNYPIVSPITFYEFVFVFNNGTKVIDTKNPLQVIDVAALLEEHQE